MTRHPIHVKYARSFAVRGVENLVIGHMYQQMHWPSWMSPHEHHNFNPRPKRLLAVGLIGYQAADGLRGGWLTLDMDVVHPIQSPNQTSNSKLVWQAYRPSHPYEIWYATDAGVEDYPSGPHQTNFLLDITDLGMRGITLVGDPLDHSAL